MSADCVSLTVCISGGGTGVDSTEEQEKLEARKMLENAAREGPPPTARFVGLFFALGLLGY